MSIFDPILDLIFPKFCARCGQYGTYLCGRCASTIRYYSLPLCPGCMGSIDHLGVHAKCQKKTALDGLLVSAPFSGVIKQMLVGIKYHGWFDQIGRLSEISYRILERNNPRWLEEIRPRVLIPVPLHPEKLEERGFNQSELIAQYFSKQTGVPLQKKVLQKTKQTASQASLSRKERLENLEDVHSVRIRLKRTDTILLLDDVVTTGATFSACAKALKRAGCGKVYGVAIAHGH